MATFSIGTQARLDSGELLHIRNAEAPLQAEQPCLPISNDRAELRATIEQLERLFGKSSMYTGNALNGETGKATGVPNMVGVYVVAEAYREAMSAIEQAAGTGAQNLALV